MIVNRILGLQNNTNAALLKSSKTENTKEYTNQTELSSYNPAYLTNINFTAKKDKPENFRLNLSMEELEKRTSKDYMTTKVLLTPDSVEYQTLSDGDKKALKHLVKAAYILDGIEKQLDSSHNLPFENYLDREIKKGNKRAELTKVLYNGQKGIFALDSESNKISLAKGLKESDGKGVYPEDLKKEEFHQILIKMLNEGKDGEVRQILSQRTVVERDKDELKAIDYVDKYKSDFSKMADELDKAAKVSTNSDFNEYLKLQAKALRKADPKLDAKADIKWATLQDTPLEFTITRENYDESMTESVMENEQLKKMLNERNIVPVSKDFLGGRVGIVNKKGTDAMLGVKEYLPIMAEQMPYKNEYTQTISTSGKDTKQTMVDVDLVAMTGDVGAYRGGITLAENLPNNDKLAIQMGGGRRNVYHRQIRMSGTDSIQQKLDAVLNPKQHKYYSPEAEHWFVIGHENGHSLGPKNGKDSLGKYKSIIEENKADMVAIGMLDTLVENGLYTEEQKKQIIVSFALKNLLKAKPDMSHAHRVRSAMQTNYFIKEGAMDIDDNGILTVNIDKMVPTAQKMLKEIVRVQIDGDFKKGEQYVMDNLKWTDKMQKSADNLKRVSKSLNGTTSSLLADKLVAEK